MSLLVNKPTTEVGEKIINAYGTITASGNYVSGGDPLSFIGKLHGGRNLEFLSVIGESGFLYRWVKGTDLSDQKLIVMQGDNDLGADGPAVELPVAAYPGGVSGDTIRYHAQYKQSI